MHGLLDFILYILDQEQEDLLWDLWMHKDVNEDFKTFKQKRMVPIRRRRAKSNTPEQDLAIIMKNSRFITHREDGGKDEQ